jgi:hypothetical protein
MQGSAGSNQFFGGATGGAGRSTPGSTPGSTPSESPVWTGGARGDDAPTSSRQPLVVSSIQL